jgi:hypothetical protein
LWQNQNASQKNGTFMDRIGRMRLFFIDKPVTALIVVPALGYAG